MSREIGTLEFSLIVRKHLILKEEKKKEDIVAHKKDFREGLIFQERFSKVRMLTRIILLHEICEKK